jgi:hypothetical protein
LNGTFVPEVSVGVTPFTSIDPIVYPPTPTEASKNKFVKSVVVVLVVLVVIAAVVVVVVVLVAGAAVVVVVVVLVVAAVVVVVVVLVVVGDVQEPSCVILPAPPVCETEPV